MIQDYYIDIHYVYKETIPDGTGGYEQVYKIGEIFRGTAVKSSSNEQIAAGVRGIVGEQYTITAPKDTKIVKGSIIMFRTKDDREVFLVLNSNLTYTPDKANQQWKYGTATNFEPDLRVVE